MSCSDPPALNGEIFKLISPLFLDHCNVQQLGMTPGGILNVTSLNEERTLSCMTPQHCGYIKSRRVGLDGEKLSTCNNYRPGIS